MHFTLAGVAPKRLRNETMGQNGQGRQQQRGVGRRQGGTGRGGQRYGKWSMPGFVVDPGGGVLVAGRYTVEAVQSQVILQGPVGREVWLAVDLRRGKGERRSQAGCRAVSCREELQAMLTGLQG